MEGSCTRVDYGSAYSDASNMTDILMFSTCLFFTGCLIFILIYFLITLSDLECDYLNATECCGKLNFVRKISTFSPILCRKSTGSKLWRKFVANCTPALLSYFAVERAKVVATALHPSHAPLLRPLAALSLQLAHLRVFGQKVRSR